MRRIRSPARTWAIGPSNAAGAARLSVAVPRPARFNGPRGRRLVVKTGIAERHVQFGGQLMVRRADALQLRAAALHSKTGAFDFLMPIRAAGGKFQRAAIITHGKAEQPDQRFERLPRGTGRSIT